MVGVYCFLDLRLTVYTYVSGAYRRCSKTFLALFFNKMLVIKAGFHKKNVKIANREDPDQTDSSKALGSGSALFRQATIVQNSKTFTITFIPFPGFSHNLPQVSIITKIPGRIAQSVTHLATESSMTSDPRVTSLIPARSHTFVEIDHEIISTIIRLPSAESFKKGCCQLQVKVCAQSAG